MQLVYGLVKDNMYPYETCIDCCTVNSNGAHSDSDLVVGGDGGCTYLLHTALTCTNISPDL